MNKYIIAKPYFASSFADQLKGDNCESIELFSANGFEFDASAIEFDPAAAYYLISNANFNNQSRTLLFSQLLGKGIKPQCLVSSSAKVASNVKLGMATIIHNNVNLATGVAIGFNTIVGPNGIFDEGVKIGNNCFVGPNVVLHPGVVIGSGTYIKGNIVVEAGVKIDKDVVINDAFTSIRADVKSGIILDKQIGDFVRIMK
jgi:acyl-[acyl carrier protein]--UDP-N-acetylglucosamine O-acyltransferase